MTTLNDIHLTNPLVLGRLAAILAATVAVSAFLTRCCLTLLPRLGFIDKAGQERKIHLRDTPRGGGISVVIGTMVGVALFFISIRYFNWFPAGVFHFRNFVHISLPLLILVPLGLLDDRFALKSWVKLLGQIATALLAWYFGIRMDVLFGCHLPVWLSLIATACWFIGFINAYNLIDGMDGLASGLAVISLGCLAFISFHGDLLYGFIFSMLLGSACLGFLFYNFPPAKIFLGDTGSMSIGYFLGVFGILLERKMAIASAVVIPLLACGVPIIDVIFAIWRRVTRKMLNPHDASIGIMTADRLHIHHRILSHCGANQTKAVMSIYGLAGLLALVAIICVFIPSRQGYLGFFVLLATFSVVAFHFASIEIWNSSRLIFDDWARRRPGTFCFIFQPVFDVAVLLAAAWMASNKSYFNCRFIFQAITPICVVLLFSRNFHVLWKFPSPEEYFRYILTIGIGTLLSWGYVSFKGVPEPTFRQLFNLFCYACVGGLSQRLFLHYLRMRLVKTLNCSKYLNQTIHRIMLYGLEDNGRAYINHSLSRFSEAACDKILGFIAAEPVYRKTYCYNLPVWGHLLEISEIYQRHPFSKIVVCHQQITPEEYRLLDEFCKKHQVVLARFNCHEQLLSPLNRCPQ